MSIICTTKDLEALIPEGFTTESEVIVSHFDEAGIAQLQKLRNAGDHRPLLFITKSEDAETLSALKNCCGGGILPPFTEARMTEALRKVAVMEHGAHCE